MNLRARVALFASLAFLLPPLTSPGQAEPTEAGAGASAPSEQLHQRPHSPAEALRGHLPGDGVDRVPTTPFLPAAPVDPGSWPVGVPEPADGSLEADVGALLVLPSSRAPPALS